MRNIAQPIGIVAYGHIRFALTRYDTLRIDTHQDNAPMRHAIAKEGFTYCGLIHCWNGDERLAFHLSKTQKEE